MSNRSLNQASTKTREYKVLNLWPKANENVNKKVPDE